jgi:hypothetical protein
MVVGILCGCLTTAVRRSANLWCLRVLCGLTVTTCKWCSGGCTKRWTLRSLCKVLALHGGAKSGGRSSGRAKVTGAVEGHVWELIWRRRGRLAANLKIIQVCLCIPIPVEDNLFQCRDCVLLVLC